MLFVNRLAIAYPNIAFLVTNNNKVLLQTQGKIDEENSFANVISNVYGNDVAKNLIYFKGKNSLYEVEGYTTKNSVFRSNKNYINSISLHSKYMHFDLHCQSFQQELQPYSQSSYLFYFFL